MKRFLLTTAFASLFFVFAACDDDGSSVVEPGDESSSAICEDCDDSSSSVKSSSSVAPKSSESAKSSSSVIPASSGNLQSSSSKKESSSSVKSSSSAKSSSSVIPASSGDLQSSSSNKESSSSAKSCSSAKSSSSVIPASSGNLQSSSSNKESSSSAKSSSSSAKSSSSSSVSSSSSIKSSSSYDHTLPLSGRLFDEYKQFTDERNGRSYYYITIRGKNSKKEVDSVTVMAENLNIGKMIGSGLDQANDTLIERYCYDRDTTNCDRYGGLYQWAEMMQLPSRCNTESCADLIQENHQGICPDGWRLLTQEDFYIVLHADGNTHGIAGVRSSYGFNGFNSTGYSLVGAGYVWNRKLTRIGEATYWYYPEEGSYSEDGEVISTAFVASTSRSGEYLSEQETLKTQGLSVRCVKMD